MLSQRFNLPGVALLFALFGRVCRRPPQSERSTRRSATQGDSFWRAPETYAKLSPFFHADRMQAPILLIHGGADENPGTPVEQSERFFHALAGTGAAVRYVKLPHEGHRYFARESVLHGVAESIEWLDRML